MSAEVTLESEVWRLKSQRSEMSSAHNHGVRNTETERVTWLTDCYAAVLLVAVMLKTLYKQFHK